jgi:flavin reductase (DIM6/NTAB) family NADH-FMN oxidoreductase RutF
LNEQQPRLYRTALGRFATGVTIVTALDGRSNPVGLTVSSFNSVSLDPPLVGWNLGRKSSALKDFEQAGHFVVHVLSEDQAVLCTQFTGARERRFDKLDWSSGLGGAPLIAGALAVFECSTHARHDGGDHLIILGRVERFTQREGRPLVYFQGRYGAAADILERTPSEQV